MAWPWNPRERSFFPLVELRMRHSGSPVAAISRRAWRIRLRRGRPGYSGAEASKCTNPNFGDAGLAIAKYDIAVIRYLTDQKVVLPDSTIVVGQSAGGWVSVTVTCVTSLADVSVPGVPGAKTLTATSTAHIDPYRAISSQALS